MGVYLGVSGEPIPDHLWMGTSVLLPLWTMIWDAAVLDPSLNSSRMGPKGVPKGAPFRPCLGYPLIGAKMAKMAVLSI